MLPRGLRITAILICLSIGFGPAAATAGESIRARELGIPFEGQPGPLNAITDVSGVEVGHITLIEGVG
jgi:D-aminopeptidase